MRANISFLLFRCKGRCKTVSINVKRAFHEKCNNAVSGEQRVLMQLKTSKDQSNICRSEAACYYATIFRNNLRAIAFCIICEYRSQVKGFFLRCNFTAQWQHKESRTHWVGNILVVFEKSPLLAMFCSLCCPLHFTIMLLLSPFCSFLVHFHRLLNGGLEQSGTTLLSPHNIRLYFIHQL